MIVRFLESAEVNDRLYLAGQSHEFDDETAVGLLATGKAEAVESPAPVVSEPFTPVDYVGVIDLSDGVNPEEAALAGKALSEYVKPEAKPESAASAVEKVVKKLRGKK